jgi:tyrosinase
MSGRNDDLVIVRKNINNVRSDELMSFRTAMGKFMAIRDNRGYNRIAGFHGAPDWWCWHHEGNFRNAVLRARLFLPWHRAYLKYFEDHLRDHDVSVSQPWWDWTSPLSRSQGFPEAYSEETMNNESNPLAKFHMSVLGQPVPGLPDITLDRDTRRDPASPSILPRPSDVQRLYDDVEDFGQFSDQLEDIHDFIHGWCGADMSDVTTAGFDPVFWAHHCNVDRIWWIWQLRHGNSTMPPELLDLSLPPFPYKVREVLSIYDLGYDYATTSAEVVL